LRRLPFFIDRPWRQSRRKKSLAWSTLVTRMLGPSYVDLLSGAKGDDAKEHDLGEAGVTGEENPS